ncbi:flagellar protein FlgN [Photobacterium sp. CCB-ST2H9]|uniref:flagella synthesis protein FlgN n=1 Tax=unclassified Photobacterium TaxID=2628852 RepID=UPI00200493E5|nr:flagellar protein FlgN [Photobacterium sp. CCB-ST2H9]UTM58063.1 flagellar protein FlgN [Photobacterium sp. CCB-ST2H9]
MSPNIEQLLAQQHATLEALLRLLEQEREAIVKRQSGDITRFARDKKELVDKIQLQDQQIARHSQSSQLKENPDFVSQVDTIQHLLSECMHHNELNGAALQRAQLSFHKLNNLFQQSLGHHQTYNKEGIAQNLRSIGTNLKA